MVTVDISLAQGSGIGYAEKRTDTGEVRIRDFGPFFGNPYWFKVEPNPVSGLNRWWCGAEKLELIVIFAPLGSQSPLTWDYVTHSEVVGYYNLDWGC